MRNVDNISLQNLEGLHAEIRRVKERILDREEKLVEKFAQVPGETAKSILKAVLPLFLGKELAAGAWKLLQGPFDLIAGKTPESGKGDNWKNNIVGGAKKLGIFTALKLLFNLWKGK